ncbi:GGDEF domain-containing protein [uncultured Ferrimonas sp.]|uniref:GGDEF domain-containing protein n=1 Tax=uncultured Ferrimonas sp. TaxID=432640 RepID=UPI00262961C1|nr:GGDEF domain-containing protein [uncultured Ferrimonas sp.]
MNFDSNAISDHSHRLPILRVLLGILCLTYLFFFYVNIVNQRYSLALVELATLLYCILMLQISRYSRNLSPWVILLMLGFGFTQLYALATSTISMNGPLMWSFLVPVFTYPLLGSRTALLLSAVYVVLFCGIATEMLLTGASHIFWLDVASFAVLYCTIWAVKHIHERQRSGMMQSLRASAEHDPMTQLLNRSQLNNQIEQLTLQQQPFTLVLIDVDHFKQVNDQYGHPAGDAVLIHIANLLRNGTRSSDCPFRLGGEEFCLLLPETELAGSSHLVSVLQQQLGSTPCQYDGIEIHTSFSAGLAQWPTDGKQLHELYSCADRRLYLAKNDGRNTIKEQG